MQEAIQILDFASKLGNIGTPAVLGFFIWHLLKQIEQGRKDRDGLLSDLTAVRERWHGKSNETQIEYATLIKETVSVASESKKVIEDNTEVLGQVKDALVLVRQPRGR